MLPLSDRAGGGLRAFGHGEDGVRDLRRVVDSVAAAHHRLAGNRGTPGEAEARSDVVPIGGHQFAAEGRCLGGDGVADDEAVELDIHNLVVLLLVALEVVPAQAEVEGEARRDLEIVVGGEGDPVVVEVGAGVGGIDAVAADIAEHEIGHGASGVGSVETEGAARSARLSEGHAATIDFGVELEEVAALLPGDDIGKRSDGVGTDARADLALQVVHVVDAIGSVERD